MKELQGNEFFDLFDPEVHQTLKDVAKKFDADGMIVFENLQMDSSQFGERTAVVFGSCCTYKTAQDAEGKWLYDLPSQRQYATAWVDAVWLD